MTRSLKPFSGIDCVYTVEASLAGSQSNHYLAGDYLNLGKCLCFGFVLCAELFIRMSICLQAVARFSMRE